VLVAIDTNVFVTALLQGATPRRVYHAFLSGKLTPVFSSETLGELLEVLTRAPLRVLMSDAEVDAFLTLIQRDSFIVEPTRHFQLCRDRKDNMWLDCVFASRVLYLVTSDKDLLALDPFHGTRILRPAEFLRRLS